MADISRIGGGTRPISPAVSRGSQIRSSEGAAEAPAPKAPQEKQLDDLVSVSEDGDTVQVSPEAENILEEESQGRVITLSGRE